MQALTMEETTADVAIVGGGIAGGALPVRLARAGLAVTVLEQSAELRDRVRGETVFPWGYAELVRSGLLDIAMRAEGTVAPRLVPYGDSMSPHAAGAVAMDTTAVVPGAAGMLNLSHPGACHEPMRAAVAPVRKSSGEPGACRPPRARSRRSGTNTASASGS